MQRNYRLKLAYQSDHEDHQHQWRQCFQWDLEDQCCQRRLCDPGDPVYRWLQFYLVGQLDRRDRYLQSHQFFLHINCKIADMIAFISLQLDDTCFSNRA